MYSLTFVLAKFDVGCVTYSYAFVYIILYVAAQRVALVDKFLIGLEIALLLLLLAFSKFGMAFKSDT